MTTSSFAQQKDEILDLLATFRSRPADDDEHELSAEPPRPPLALLPPDPKPPRPTLALVPATPPAAGSPATPAQDVSRKAPAGLGSGARSARVKRMERALRRHRIALDGQREAERPAPRALPPGPNAAPRSRPAPRPSAAQPSAPPSPRAAAPRTRAPRHTFTPAAQRRPGRKSSTGSNDELGRTLATGLIIFLLLHLL